MKKFLLLMFLHFAAFGQLVVTDPSNLIQTKLLALNSVTELQNQATEIKYQLQNLLKYDQGSTQWSNAKELLDQLSTVMSKGNAIAYSAQNADQLFSQRFPGYHQEENYNRAYQTWSSTTLDTLRNSLTNAGIQVNDMQSEQAAMNQLKELSVNSQGRLQAIEVANMIAANQVGQIQKLRQLMTSQTQAQSTYMAYQVQKEQSAAAVEDKMLSNPLPYPTYGEGQGFGKDNMPQIHQ